MGVPVSRIIGFCVAKMERDTNILNRAQQHRWVLSMNNRLIVASTLTAAVGVALAIQLLRTPQIVKDNMARVAKGELEKCYGINAAAKNDCAEGAHSCAGHATIARDMKSFVLLPGGDCDKIQGGRLTPA
jgi:uncharacterized membrane protein